MFNKLVQSALSALTLVSFQAAKAVDVQCTDNSTTFIYRADDLKVLSGGELKDHAIVRKGNIDSRGTGCLFELAEGITIPGKSTVRVDIFHKTAWEGTVETLDETKGPNRIMFNAEFSSANNFEVYHYRLGEMKQDVLVDMPQHGKYLVEAVSKNRPFSLPPVTFNSEVSNLNVSICEARIGVETAISEVRVQYDLRDVNLCE